MVRGITAQAVHRLGGRRRGQLSSRLRVCSAARTDRGLPVFSGSARAVEDGPQSILCRAGDWLCHLCTAAWVFLDDIRCQRERALVCVGSLGGSVCVVVPTSAVAIWQGRPGADSDPLAGVGVLSQRGLLPSFFVAATGLRFFAEAHR